MTTVTRLLRPRVTPYPSFIILLIRMSFLSRAFMLLIRVIHLFRIMTNAYINVYRKAQRRPTESPTDEITDWQLAANAEHDSTGLESTEVEALKNIPDERIRDALMDLPEDNRMVVYYADVEGMPYKEIAHVMGTPVGTVMSRLHRGRKKLREALKEVASERGIGGVQTAGSAETHK